MSAEGGPRDQTSPGNGGGRETQSDIDDDQLPKVERPGKLTQPGSC